ncbi:MAG TPA: SDR family oxidoreductase, partial [Pseudobacillus sp.]
SAFAAAKAGLASLTRTISMEEAKNGITANMICPGDIADYWKEETIANAKRVTSSVVPVGRPGTGEDLARVVAFLISDHADFITGSMIPVTGGQDVLGKIYHADHDSRV